MARTLDEIKQEYSNLCVKAGNLQYNIHVLSKDLELINESLRDLNLEASKLPQEATTAQVTTNA